MKMVKGEEVLTEQKHPKLTIINQNSSVKTLFRLGASRKNLLPTIQNTSNKVIDFNITHPVSESSTRRKNKVHLECIRPKMDWLKGLLIAAIVFGKFIVRTGCDDAQDFQRNMLTAGASFLTTTLSPFAFLSSRKRQLP